MSPSRACVSMRLRWPLGPAALERRQPIATHVLMCVYWRPHFDAHNHAPCIDDSVLKHHRQRLRSEDEAIEVNRVPNHEALLPSFAIWGHRQQCQVTTRIPSLFCCVVLTCRAGALLPRRTRAFSCWKNVNRFLCTRPALICAKY